MTRTGLAVLLAAALGGCVRAPKSSTVYLDEVIPPRAPAEFSPEAPVDPMNDLARLLAGMEGGRGAPLNGFRATADAKVHASRMAMLWRSHEVFRGKQIRGWSAAQLGDLQGAANVFYPFGGPDFLFPAIYFPEARRYVLVGLEDVPFLPDPATMSAGELARGLDGMSDSLGEMLEFGYFQTASMRSGFGRTRFRGVTPVLLSFLARTGHTIETVAPVGLTANGGVETRTSEGHPCPGVHIRCRSSSGVRKDVYYFKEDLGDASLRSDRRILTFVRSGGKPVTYLKSASYLLHGGGFDEVRNFIVGESRAVVQDPSGVPFRNFLGPGWDLRLYGFYYGPLKLFAQYYQADLVAAYESGAYPVMPINFGAGYQINPGESSLLVARRR